MNTLIKDSDMDPFSNFVGVPLKEPPDQDGIDNRQAEDSSEPE
jgi:hypothetical protein